MFYRNASLRAAGIRLALLVLFTSPKLFSQTDTSAHHLAKAVLDRQLNEMVVQATRTDRSSPVPHTNISAEQIAKQSHAQDVPYLLSSIPSLVESSDGGTGIGYTGLRIRGSDPTRVNVTINGLPLNDAESQGVFWVDLPDLAASATEIQVQRGVGASTNGAGAFGASVNLDLSSIATERFATLSNTLGAFNTRKHSVHLGTGLIKQKFAFTARVSGIYSDGYVDRASADLNSVHLSGAYIDNRQTAQVHLLSGKEITYQAWNGLPAQYLEDNTLRTYNSAGTERPGSPHPDEVDNYAQRHLLAHYKYILLPNLLLQLNGHYTKGFGYYEQYKADQNIFNYGLPIGLVADTMLPPMDLIRRLWLDNNFYGGTFALKWSAHIPWKPKAVLGGAWSRYTGKHFGEVIWTEGATGASNDYRYYENDAEKQDANAFLKIEASPVSDLSAFLDLQVRGVRYQFLGFDRFLNNVQQTATLAFFNPKIGASYSMANDWSAYTFLGVGHREPNRDDYTQSTPDSRPRPEQLLDLEAGVRRINNRWSFSANAFWMRYNDQLVLDGRINDVGGYTRTNVPLSWRSGIELEGSAAVTDGLSLTGNVSLSQNKVREFTEYLDNWDTGEQQAVAHRNTDLAFSPKLIARTEVSWVLLRSRTTRLSGQEKGQTLSASLIGKYVGAQFLDNTSNPLTALSDYFVGDMRINYDVTGIIGRQASFIVSVNNLFDTKYASNGWSYRYVSANYDARQDNPYTRLEGDNVYHQAGFFPQAGRHWMATLRLAF